MKLYVLLALAPACIVAQKFPGSVATDADLTIAKNNIREKLASSVSSSATTVTLSAPTAFVANMVASIDAEIVFVCAVSGNTLTIGTPTACPSVGGRGYDGTVAATHNIGPCTPTNLAGCVVANVTAIQHNSPASEIKAIETALGPNLRNVATSSSTAKNAQSYAFAPQSPGGSLIVGNNTITLNPVPAGMNGTDTGHYVYISGGSGSPEACLITGGTAVSGGTTGTLVIQCANTHTGAWTIAPASGGIQEAIVAGGPNSAVSVPCGSYNIYGSITIANQDQQVWGFGNCSVLSPQVDAISVFNATSVAGFMNLDIGGFQIVSAPATPVLNSIKAVNLTNDTNYRVHDINCVDIFFCVYLDRGGTSATIERITLQGNSTIWAGSTTDASGAFLGSAVFNNISQYPVGRAGSLAMTASHYYITLQRCVTCTVTHFKTSSLQGVTNGILMANDDEGCTIDDAAIVVPINGIVLKQTTVGSTQATPSWTKLTNIDIDRWGAAGIGEAVHVDNAGLFNKLENSTITGGGTSYASGVHLAPGSYGTIISGNTFQNFPGANVIWLESVSYNAIVNNYFQGLTNVIAILASPGLVDYTTIAGNVFDTRQNMLTCLAQGGGSFGSHNVLSGNVGTTSATTCP